MFQPPVRKHRPGRHGGRLAAAVLFAVLFALLSASALPAAGQKARIEVRVPAAMEVGEAARLEILLLDAEGRSVAAPKDLRVVVRGVEALAEGEEFVFPAGAEAIAVELIPKKPGAWVAEVVVEGLEPVWVPCAAIRAESPAARGTARSWLLAAPRELPQEVPEHRLQVGPDAPAEARRVPAKPVEIRPVGPSPTAREAEARRESEAVPQARFEEGAKAFEQAVAPTPELDEVRRQMSAARRAREASPPEGARDGAGPAAGQRGDLRLIPGEAVLGPGADGGYRVQIFAFWFEAGEPALRSEPLPVNLVADPLVSELSVDPSSVELPAGEMRASAEVTARREGEVAVRALYPGGESAPARIRFDPPRPERLEFVGLPQRVRTLGVADLEVAVRLLDGAGRPTVAAGELQVTVSAVGETGTESWTLTVPAGGDEGRTRIELERFGKHRLSARAVGLEPAAAPIQMSFDLPVLLWAFGGGFIGGLVPLIRAARRDRTRWQIARALVLAVAAAGLVEMMAAFGLLGWLARSDAGGLWSGVAGLPVASQAAAFLTGFLAGFVGDALYQRLRGALGGTPGPAGG